MANKKRNYTVRYDRIIGALIALIFISLVIAGLVSYTKQKKTKSDQPPLSINSAQNEETLRNYPSISIENTKIHSGNLILVNDTYPCLFDTKAIEAGTSSDVTLTTIKSLLDSKKNGITPYTASDWVVSLDRVAARAMDQWLETFYHETGLNQIRMIRGYQTDGITPDFRTGRTLMLGIFEKTDSHTYHPDGEYAWIAEHAADYGFITRYPEGKESYFNTIPESRDAIFRYVGLPAAAYIQKYHLCLEEFIEQIKDYHVENMLTITNGSKTYGMYYTQANSSGEKTEIQIPSDDAVYDISGNNIDGFIITIYE